MKKIISIFSLCMLLVMSVHAQQFITLKGKVVGDDNLGIPGVSVLEKGTNNGITTDIDGNYTLRVSFKATIVFSFVGMTTVEEKVNGRSVINVTMTASDQALDEVVIVGFGTQKKENLTGAVATVDSKVLESRPVSNVVQALQGAVAGVNFSVGNGGGQLDNNMSFNIRGAGTIGSGSIASPLVLIDGVEGNLSSLNPQDIENISFLKDAASSSIYGARAAFGVVLVTTKSGKKGAVTVNYTSNFRLSSPVLQLKTMDSEKFAYYFNDAAKNANGGSVFSKETIENCKWWFCFL